LIFGVGWLLKGGRIPARLPMTFQVGLPRGRWLLHTSGPEERPVLKAILASLEQRIQTVCALTANLTSSITSQPNNALAATIAVLPELQRLLDEIKELAGWAGDPFHALPAAQRQVRTEGLSEQLVEDGLTLKQILEMREIWQHRPRGRSPIKRLAAVRALELRLLEPKRTWASITKECCPCKKKPHDKGCAETLRQEVMMLERTLSRLGVSTTT
jgi:hypothetical protein